MNEDFDFILFLFSGREIDSEIFEYDLTFVSVVCDPLESVPYKLPTSWSILVKMK